MKTFYVCVPGILSNTSPNVGWEDSMAAAINQDGQGDVAVALEYWTGVFGLWGKTAAQKRLASVLSGAMCSDQTPRLAVVTHSFGSVILLGALLKYTMTTSLDEAHLVAAACPEDCEKNGLNQLLRDGRIGRLYVYTSTGDEILEHLAPLQRWRGFGQMGYHGPVNVAKDVEARVKIVPHNDYGHEDWVYSHFSTTLGEVLNPTLA